MEVCGERTLCYAGQSFRMGNRFAFTYLLDGQPTRAIGILSAIFDDERNGKTMCYVRRYVEDRANILILDWTKTGEVAADPSFFCAYPAAKVVSAEFKGLDDETKNTPGVFVCDEAYINFMNAYHDLKFRLSEKGVAV